MKKIKVKLIFSLYKTIGTLLLPVLPFYLSMRAARGKEELKRFREKLGVTSKTRPKGSLVWLHAASVGETVALIPIIDHILLMNIHVLLTTGTVSSAKLAQDRFGDRLIHQYAPLDISLCVQKFLNIWQPDIAIICESELWPMRIFALAKRRIAQIVLNAHLSEKSFASWRKRPVLSRAIFSKLDAVVCQTDNDQRYFRHLGAKRVSIAGNLKADVVLPANTKEVKSFKDAIGSRPVWAAISTHEGEEELAIDVHKKLLKKHPNLLTIIVPRHIERSEMIVEYIKKSGLNFIKRTDNLKVTSETQILLGDTIGDMGLYLRLTEIVFIGKSLTAQGGHNPLEPALTGAAILTGPNIENFKQSYQALKNNDAVHLVDDATTLAGYVHFLLTHPESRRRMIKSGHNTVVQLRGAAERSFAILAPFLEPLTLLAQLQQIEK